MEVYALYHSLRQAQLQYHSCASKSSGVPLPGQKAPCQPSTFGHSPVASVEGCARRGGDLNSHLLVDKVE